jgi:hypothetical protein
MLSDRQKEQLSAEMVPLFQELEQDIIQDIARRVRKEKRWTETAELQAKALEAMGYKPMEIRNKVMRELKADKAYQAMIAKNTLEHKRAVRESIKQLVADAKAQGDDIVSRAGTMAFNDDLSFWKSKGRHLRYSPELGKINQSASKRLARELKNLTHSTGFKFIGAPIREDRVFSHAMDSAIMNIASGGFSSGQAIEKVVSDLEKSGIRHVDFGSGISRGIDVAAALAVRTTLGQMAAEISMSNANELGTDLVEVSSHVGAREGDGHADHASWQGKVYSISGRRHPEEEARLGYKIEKLSDATGYPDDPLGLCGYNCRHTFYPFLEGVSEPNPIVKDPEPVMVDGRTYTYYQASQVQRRLERELRELKRQYIGGDKTRLAAIKAKEQRYARFCGKAGLKQNLERIYVKGYKRDFEYIKQIDGFTTTKFKARMPAKNNKVLFEPSKTLDEAQKYARQFCNDGFFSRTFKGEVLYSGIDIENANAINKALTEVYSKIELDKISGIKAISPTSSLGKKAFKGDTNAVFAYSPVENGIFINKNILKNKKTFTNYVNESKDAWNLVMSNFDSLTKEQQSLAEVYKNAGRSLVRGDTVEGMFTHELGHHAQWTLFDPKTNNLIGSRMSEYAPKISGYANASKSEYFAESFNAYLKAELNLLDPEFVNALRKKKVSK